MARGCVMFAKKPGLNLGFLGFILPNTHPFDTIV
jgi:hypothetical protein